MAGVGWMVLSTARLFTRCVDGRAIGFSFPHRLSGMASSCSHPSLGRRNVRGGHLHCRESMGISCCLAGLRRDVGRRHLRCRPIRNSRLTDFCLDRFITAAFGAAHDVRSARYGGRVLKQLSTHCRHSCVSAHPQVNAICSVFPNDLRLSNGPAQEALLRRNRVSNGRYRAELLF